MESRREKFVELAEKRVTRTLKDIRLVGNLANKSNYAYEDQDIKKILSAIEAEVKNLRRRFEDTTDESEISFKL